MIALECGSTWSSCLSSLNSTKQKKRGDTLIIGENNVHPTLHGVFKRNRKQRLLETNMSSINAHLQPHIRKIPSYRPISTLNLPDPENSTNQTRISAFKSYPKLPILRRTEEDHSRAKGE